ncbi:MAG: macro domain-containing protein [Clostridia bacterium]|nr:macro domain-containing protein [Clostridia bacterium]
MPFEIIRDDITRVAADAIVNTANPNPVIGAGTDSAIHRAAGPGLLAAREKIGKIPVGSAAETAAFDLPAKYILHTVSPAWVDGTHGEEALLRQAYDAALALADRLGCRSAAFPLLSSGSYGFPKDRALSVAIGAFTEFLLTHDLRISLVVFGQESVALARGLFGDLRAYIDDRYVSEVEKLEYAPLSDEADHRHVSNRRPNRAEARFGETASLTPTGERKHRKASFFDSLEAAEAKDAAFESMPASAGLSSIFDRVESTFSEHLIDLLRECGEKDSDVYRRAEISRQLFHKIVTNKHYQPTKSTAIQLALGLRLNLAETQKLLEKAGYALTRSSKADLVVQYFIERGEYSIVVINTALFDCGLPLLKTGGAS